MSGSTPQPEAPRFARSDMTTRRDFVVGGSVSIAAALLGACDSEGPKQAERLLDFAERKNEALERSIFRHTSMDKAKAGARPTRGGPLARPPHTAVALAIAQGAIQ